MRHNYIHKKTKVGSIGTIVYAFYLKCGLEDTVRHTVSEAMTLTVIGLVRLVGQKHQVYLEMLIRVKHYRMEGEKKKIPTFSI